ncbi:unnamed protein product [Arctogadus glacialis]
MSRDSSTEMHPHPSLLSSESKQKAQHQIWLPLSRSLPLCFPLGFPRQGLAEGDGEDPHSHPQRGAALTQPRRGTRQGRDGRKAPPPHYPPDGWPLAPRSTAAVPTHMGHHTTPTAADPWTAPAHITLPIHPP